MSGLSKLLLAGRQCDVRAGESVERSAHSNNVIYSQILCQKINILTWDAKNRRQKWILLIESVTKYWKIRRFRDAQESVSVPKSGKGSIARIIEKSENDRENSENKSNFNETSTRGEKILGGADGWSRISELFFTS